MTETSTEMAARITPLRVRHHADKTTETRVTMSRVPQASVEIDEQTGDIVFDPAAARSVLVNPDTPGYDHEAWPSAGWSFVDATGADTEEAPEHIRVSMRQIAVYESEGFAVTEGKEIVHAPGGPPENEWAKTHTFVQLDAVVFQTDAGDVRYRVTHQPGKYDDPSETSGKRVDWFYNLELED